MARDEVGDHVLLEAVLGREALEALDEGVVDLAARLAHHAEHRVAHVLGRQAQLAAHVVLEQLDQELVARVGHGVVEADAAAHEDLLDAGKLPQVAQQVGVGVLVHVHVAAHARP